MLQMLNVHACTHVLSVGLIHTSLVLEEEPRDGKATLPCRIHAGTDQRSVTVSVGAVDGHAQDAVSEGGCEVEYLLYLLYPNLLCRHACGRGVCVLCVCCVCVCVCVCQPCVCVSAAHAFASPLLFAAPLCE